jgi:hypothetical protein
MGRIVRMSKLYPWDHMLNHVQEIRVRALPHLARRECTRCVEQEKGAQSLQGILFLEQGIDPLGKINDLLAIGGFDNDSVHERFLWQMRDKSEILL